jgi:formate hydrogenlyase transcriptional activator
MDAFFQAQFGFVPRLFQDQILLPGVVEAESRTLAQILIPEDLLSRVQKEKIVLVISAANRNTYSVALHRQILATRGVALQDSDQIVDDYRRGAISPAEIALLDEVRKLACCSLEKEAGFSSTTLRAHGFSEPQILEAVATAAVANFLNTLQAGLGTVPDFPPGRVFTEKDRFPSSGPTDLIKDATAREEPDAAWCRAKYSRRAAQVAAAVSQAVIMGAAQGIILCDRELRYQLFNPFMERLTGKTADQVLGRVAAEVFPRLRTCGIEDALRRALAGETVTFRTLLIPEHSASGRDVWVSNIYSPHRAPDGAIIGVVALVRDVTDRHLEEGRFRSIVVGTASATGKDFFPTLVQHMATALQARYAFVTDCDDQRHAKALAFWTGDRFGDLFEFDIADTPCMKVLNGEVCRYQEGLQNLFPLDTVLADLHAESYLGVPMLDSEGRVMGHIAILDDKPMEGDADAIDLVKIFASRAAAELKRQRAEAELHAALLRVQKLEQKNRTLLEITNALITSLKREELLSGICQVLRGVATFNFAGLAIYDSEVQDLRVFALEGGFERGQLAIGQLLDCAGKQTGHRWDFSRPVLRTNLEAEKEYSFEYGLHAAGVQSQCAVPLVVQGKAIGMMGFGSTNPGAYSADDLSFFQEVANQIAMSVANMQAYEEIAALKVRLQAENVYLQEEIRKEHDFEEIVGNSRALVEVLHKVETVAPTDSTVLITGETGCGKELIARAIHNRSGRKNRPLVKLNCGAIPTGLVESELFGHMKGAFTGALERRIGRFELADDGTLFLDEISELPLDTQVKLLRVLQEREFEPLGSSRTIHVDVRIIAASNRDLDKAMHEGRFRADLYYRLNVLPIVLPPLRQRRSDIPLLTSFFVERYSRQLGRQITGVAKDTMEILTHYDWPGNIRELQNVIERAVVLSRGSILKLGRDLLPISVDAAADESMVLSSAQSSTSESPSLEQVEKRHILKVLTAAKWVIEGPNGAARILDLHPNTLRSRMKKLGLERNLIKVSSFAQPS